MKLVFLIGPVLLLFLAGCINNEEEQFKIPKIIKLSSETNHKIHLHIIQDLVFWIELEDQYDLYYYSFEENKEILLYENYPSSRNEITGEINYSNVTTKLRDLGLNDGEIIEFYEHRGGSYTTQPKWNGIEVFSEKKDMESGPHIYMKFPSGKIVQLTGFEKRDAQYNQQWHPAIANGFVVWYDYSTSGSDTDIYGHIIEDEDYYYDINEAIERTVINAAVKDSYCELSPMRERLSLAHCHIEVVIDDKTLVKEIYRTEVSSDEEFIEEDHTYKQPTTKITIEFNRATKNSNYIFEDFSGSNDARIKE